MPSSRLAIDKATVTTTAAADNAPTRIAHRQAMFPRISNGIAPKGAAPSSHVSADFDWDRAKRSGFWFGLAGLPRVLAHPHGKQLIDLPLDLRRRRYGTSHGVGLLHRLAGLEGTYAVALTAHGLFTSASGTRPFRPATRSLPWQSESSTQATSGVQGDAGRRLTHRLHAARSQALAIAGRRVPRPRLALAEPTRSVEAEWLRSACGRRPCLQAPLG